MGHIEKVCVHNWVKSLGEAPRGRVVSPEAGAADGGSSFKGNSVSRETKGFGGTVGLSR